MDASNAKIQYESGQDLVPFVALTDQGDHTEFLSADPLWSKREGKTPVVYPNGLATGGTVTPGTVANDVAVAALTCYLAGVLTSVAADSTVAITRATSADTHIKNSITINSAGVIAVVAGTDSTSFSDTRGAAGGPPLIPVGSIEIAQVHTTSFTSALVTTDEIKQVVGTHVERYDYPTWTVNPFNVASGVIGNAGVEFAAALPAIHTGSVPKAIYAQYYDPSFSDIQKSDSFVPPETTHSVSSKQIYGTTLGSSSSSLNQGSFTAYLEDGISDGILGLKNTTLFFKFLQSRLNTTPYILMQGKLGISRTFPANDQITAACTVSAETAAVEVTG
jgi:hypothetical protein